MLVHPTLKCSWRGGTHKFFFFYLPSRKNGSFDFEGGGWKNENFTSDLSFLLLGSWQMWTFRMEVLRNWDAEIPKITRALWISQWFKRSSCRVGGNGSLWESCVYIYIDIFKYIIYTDYTLYSSTQRTTQKRRFSNFFLTTWIRLLFAKAKKDDPEASDVPDWLQVHWRWDFQGKNAPLEMRRPCIKGIMVPRHGAGV